MLEAYLRCDCRPVVTGCQLKQSEPCHTPGARTTQLCLRMHATKHLMSILTLGAICQAQNYLLGF